MARAGSDRTVALLSDGLAEYEAMDDGAIGVTLLRAVGELSRNDLPERPGHAGWPTPTPGAQCPGPFAAELALAPLGPWSDATIDALERTADDVLVPLGGETLRSWIGNSHGSTLGLQLHGEGLAFGACKESDDGAWTVLRCVNLLEREVHGRWTIGWRPRQATLSRLDERPGDPIPLDGHDVPFVALPRAIVTILVR